MTPVKVLFLCIHNSARSQMAEGYLKNFGGNRFIVESAGLEAGRLNPLAVQAMQEDGIDISNHQTKDVFEFFKQGRKYDYVITVCDEASAAKCPVFPGIHQKINWSFADPSALEGTPEEKLRQTKEIRDQIREAVIALIEELNRDAG